MANPTSAPVARQRSGTIDIAVNPNTAGDTEILPAQGAGIKIQVISVFAIASAPNNITFKSAATAISPISYLIASSGFVLPPNESGGWFTTAANEALNVNLSAAQPVGILVKYRLTTV